MYEELLMSEEGLQETANKLIYIGKPIEFDDKEFEQQLEQLKILSEQEESDIRTAVSRIVPTYHPSGQPETGVK